MLTVLPLFTILASMRKTWKEIKEVSFERVWRSNMRSRVRNSKQKGRNEPLPCDQDLILFHVSANHKGRQGHGEINQREMTTRG